MIPAIFPTLQKSESFPADLGAAPLVAGAVSHDLSCGVSRSLPVTTSISFLGCFQFSAVLNLLKFFPVHAIYNLGPDVSLLLVDNSRQSTCKRRPSDPPPPCII